MNRPFNFIKKLFPYALPYFLIPLYMNNFTSVLGHFAPYILFIISLLLCLPQKALLLYVFIGFYMNRAINSSFKKFLKDERPSKNYTSYEWNGEKKVDIISDTWNGQEYGMPSGHAQQTWFLTTFIYLALKNTWITLLFLLITLNSCIQRVVDNNHSVKQVIVGSLFGIVIAYFYFHLFTKFS